MSRLMAAIYDHLMAGTEEACLREWRTDLLQTTSGDVLELGSGTGINLGLYPPSVQRIVYSEPDPHMRSRLEKRLAERPDERAEIMKISAEELPFEDHSFDGVVCTLVLCTVRNPERSLSEAYRVLRPGGRIYFLEHVIAHDNEARQRWQRRLEPVWRWCADGCHVTRDTAANIEQAGFEIEKLTRASMRKAPSIVRPTIRGTAIKVV